MSEAKRQLMPGRLEATRSQVAIANRRHIASRECGIRPETVALQAVGAQK